MKKLYIFLLMIIAIQMSGLAQEQELKHLFPEVTFTYKDSTYVIPAWDGMKKASEGGVGERIQSTFEKTNPDAGETGKTEYNGIVVATSCALPPSGYPVGSSFFEDDEPVTIYADGIEPYVTTGSELKNLAYATLFPGTVLATSNNLSGIHLFSSRTGSALNSYTIPRETDAYADDPLATKYHIVGIGDGAYANPDRSSSTFIKAVKIIIPESIKSLGKYSFKANGKLETVEFENLDDVEIQEFPDGLFTDCIFLSSVTIPEQVATIGPRVFGACNRLQYLYIHRQTSPSIHNSAFNKFANSPVAVTNNNINNCIVWALSHDMARNYRNDTNNPIWQKLGFRIPIDIPASGYLSFYSDQIIWGNVPYFAGGDNYPKWEKNTDGLDIIYLGSQKSSVWNAQGGISGQNNLYVFPKWNWDTSDNRGKAIANLGLVIYRPNDTGAVLRDQSIFSPAPVRIKNDYPKVPYTIAQDLDLLKGSVEGVNMTNLISDHQDNLYLILKNGQFVRCTGGTLAPYKAYLEIPLKYFEQAGIRIDAKSFTISLDDSDTDGIKSIDNSQLKIENGVIYDLQGRVVSTNGLQALPKGIYIMNGKKYTK